MSTWNPLPGLVVIGVLAFPWPLTAADLIDKLISDEFGFDAQIERERQLRQWVWDLQSRQRALEVRGSLVKYQAALASEISRYESSVASRSIGATFGVARDHIAPAKARIASIDRMLGHIRSGNLGTAEAFLAENSDTIDSQLYELRTMNDTLETWGALTMGVVAALALLVVAGVIGGVGRRLLVTRYKRESIAAKRTVERLLGFAMLTLGAGASIATLGSAWVAGEVAAMGGSRQPNLTAYLAWCIPWLLLAVAGVFLVVRNRRHKRKAEEV